MVCQCCKKERSNYVNAPQGKVCKECFKYKPKNRVLISIDSRWEDLDDKGKEFFWKHNMSDECWDIGCMPLEHVCWSAP